VSKIENFILKSTFKNIAVGFFISIMMISTMGFSVNTLYCYCMGQYEMSLFNIEHHCNKPHGKAVESEKEDEDYVKTFHPCCQKALACAKKEASKDDCTKREKKFFKADLKFLEFQKTELPQPLYFIVEKPFFNHKRFCIAEIKNPKSQIPVRPPPQYYGRFLLNFIQVYRC
jgi:hypothetical protein